MDGKSCFILRALAERPVDDRERMWWKEAVMGVTASVPAPAMDAPTLPPEVPHSPSSWAVNSATPVANGTGSGGDGLRFAIPEYGYGEASPTGSGGASPTGFSPGGRERLSPAGAFSPGPFPSAGESPQRRLADTLKGPDEDCDAASGWNSCAASDASEWPDKSPRTN